MEEKLPSDPIEVTYAEAEYLLTEDVFIKALEPVIKLAEEKVLQTKKN
jgi:hypothetical protein